MSLKDYLISRGYPQAVTCPLDGLTHRFSRTGEPEKTPAWFRGWRVMDFECAEFGDWSIPEKHTFEPEIPASKREAYAAEFKKQAYAASQQKKIRQEEVARREQRIWEDAISLGSTLYLVKKGLQGCLTAKIHAEQTDTLLIDLRDAEGKLWCLQRIGPDGAKSFPAGGRKRGCFHTLGEISPQGDIYVCEGYATARSIFEALGGSSPVVAAFDVGNLLDVGRPLKSKFPLARLIFCADNDQKRAPRNPGVEGATAAAGVLQGELRVPVFRASELSLSDFNDLHVSAGLAVVREQLLSPKPPASATPEKKKRFSEKLVTDWMLTWVAGKLARQDKNLFRYDGMKWMELDSHGIDTLKNKINSLCGDSLPSKDVASIYNTFFRYVPAVPPGVNLFQPRSDLANFQNGTLHLDFRPKTPAELAQNQASGTHVFHLRFTPHSPTDFCTTVIPIDYRPQDELPENPALLSMFQSVWPDADQAGKIMLYEEVLGACLIPHFPQLFFFLGEPKTGKSSLIMLLGKLVGADNASHSDPTRWDRGFGMASMVNKLVNYVTDISTARKLPDDLSKQIIDGVFEIERKHKTSVLARLPAVHAFGANSMPRTGEGDSGAYDRRVVIIRTDSVQPGQGGGGQFSDWIWEQGRGGVLKAALRGLERLLSNGGIYTVPESARKEMRLWQRDNDPVVQFIEAVELGEIMTGESGTPGEKLRLVVSEDASISVSALYEIFCGTVTKYDAHGNNRTKIVDRINFVKRLYRDRRIAPQRNKLERRVSGIGIPSQE